MDTQTPIRLLVVEDDNLICSLVVEHFRSKNYSVTTVSDVETATQYLSQPRGYDVVLLDLTLRGKDGFTLLEDVEWRQIDTALLVVSARDGLEDRLRAFRLGADDYLIKPFALEELEARIKAVHRRNGVSSPQSSHIYNIDDLTINFAANTCFLGDKRIPLTALEFKILKYLVEHRGRVVPREELRKAIWDRSDAVALRTIDRHVAKIRGKLEPDSMTPTYLQTIYGKGYQFACAEYAS